MELLTAILEGVPLNFTNVKEGSIQREGITVLNANFITISFGIFVENEKNLQIP